MQDNKIAIVVVAYNRVDSLSRLLDSLVEAHYDTNNVTLIISVDKSKTSIVEDYADAFVWPYGDKIVDKHKQNLGLRPHMMSLGKWFDDYDALIVLEDDILVAESFYTYAIETVAKYRFDDNIAGISLYGIEKSHATDRLFQPIKDENDVYFIQCAQSWGQIWIKESWLSFFEWYNANQVPVTDKEIPCNILKWDSRSWLKYHMIYCIEKNKYFVYPYTSLSTNSRAAGEHAIASSSAFEVALQHGIKNNYQLPDFHSSQVHYNAFFENVSLYDSLGIEPVECCIDLSGINNNMSHKRYWLTTSKANYQILRSYDLSLRPIEMNVLKETKGCSIFLYDTLVSKRNSFRGANNLILYTFHLISMRSLLLQCNISLLLSEIISALKKKLIK